MGKGAEEVGWCACEMDNLGANGAGKQYAHYVWGVDIIVQLKHFGGISSSLFFSPNPIGENMVFMFSVSASPQAEMLRIKRFQLYILPSLSLLIYRHTYILRSR